MTGTSIVRSQQAANDAKKRHADTKVLSWLPFGGPGWNIVDVADHTGLNEDRARRSLKRLVAAGVVVQDRGRTESGLAWEYRYWRPTGRTA